MLKIGALVNLILAVSEGMLSVNWFNRSKKDNWNPKYIFFGVIWALNALMQTILACDLLSAAGAESAEADDYEEYYED